MQGFKRCAGMLRTNMVVRAGKPQVYAALTEPARLRQWLCEGADVELDRGIYRLWGRGLAGSPGQWADAVGLVASRAPELLVLGQRYAGVEVELEFILSSTIGGLNIQFSMRGLEELPDAERIRLAESWSAALLNLRGQLENARPLAMPPLVSAALEQGGRTLLRSV